jgi:hypothetical protein
MHGPITFRLKSDSARGLFSACEDEGDDSDIPAGGSRPSQPRIRHTLKLPQLDRAPLAPDANWIAKIRRQWDYETLFPRDTQ